MRNSIVVVALSFMLGALGAWLLGRYGPRLNLLDQPNHRSSHTKTTPRGGGVGIMIAFVLMSVYLGFPIFFWLTAAVLSIISLVGDRVDIPATYRLLLQLLLASLFVIYYRNEPSSPASHILLTIPLVIFMAATANYYNFMDGINGIAGISGFIGFGLLAAFVYSRNMDSQLMILSIGISSSCLGFIPFNLPHARVFMGDVGSILLGFVFAAMVIWFSKSFLDFLCLASFLFPFYADEITTEFIRLKSGEKLWTPHRRHLYQILANEFGIAHWKISAGYGAAQLLIGFSMLWIGHAGLIFVIFSVSLYFLLFCLLSSTVRRRLVNVNN